jgi:hypothetical protein
MNQKGERERKQEKEIKLFSLKPSKLEKLGMTWEN